MEGSKEPEIADDCIKTVFSDKREQLCIQTHWGCDCMQKNTKDQSRWNLNMEERGTHEVLALDEEILKMIAPGREELVCWTNLATQDPTNPINSLSEYLLKLLSL